MLDISALLEKVGVLFGGSSAGGLIGDIDPASLLDQAGIDAAGLLDKTGIDATAITEISDRVACVAGDDTPLGRIATQVEQLRSR